MKNIIMERCEHMMLDGNCKHSEKTKPIPRWTGRLVAMQFRHFLNTLFHCTSEVTTQIQIRKLYPQVWKRTPKHRTPNSNFCDKFNGNHSKRLIFCRVIGDGIPSKPSESQINCVSRSWSLRKNDCKCFF